MTYDPNCIRCRYSTPANYTPHPHNDAPTSDVGESGGVYACFCEVDRDTAPVSRWCEPCHAHAGRGLDANTFDRRFEQIMDAVDGMNADDLRVVVDMLTGSPKPARDEPVVDVYRCGHCGYRTDDAYTVTVISDLTGACPECGTEAQPANFTTASDVGEPKKFGE